ncbi:MAG: universal stress protein [Planctomycetota bacterium]
MEGFRNVLVPVDFSGLSEPALDAAVRILAPDGKATLLHVVEWLPVVTEGAFGVYPHRKELEQIKALSHEKLEAMAAERLPVRIQARVGEGRPASIILGVAEALEPDLIVIGSHGRSGLDHFLIGSVAERVIRKSRTAILVVRACEGNLQEGFKRLHGDGAPRR